MAPCSLPDVFTGLQMQARVPNDQFTMQVDSIADRGLRNLFPCMDTDTRQPDDE